MEEQKKQEFLLPFLPNPQRGFQHPFQSFQNTLYYSNNAILYSFNNNSFKQHPITFAQITQIKPNQNGEICIGDIKGGVHVMYKNGFLQKLEFGNRINGIEWIGNQKLAVVGQGKSVFGKIFNLSTKSTMGEIQHVTKSLKAVSCTKKKPFCLVVGGQQNKLLFYQGLPFKFKKSHKINKNYISSLSWDQNDQLLLVGSADKSLTLINRQLQIVRSKLQAHKGTINKCLWRNKQVISCSNDKTIKIWSSQLQQLRLIGYPQSKIIGHHQISIAIVEDYIVSLSLSGKINFWGKDDSNPQKIIDGHKSPVIGAIQAQQQILTAARDCKLGNFLLLVAFDKNGQYIRAIQVQQELQSLQSMHLIGSTPYLATTTGQILPINGKLQKLQHTIKICFPIKQNTSLVLSDGKQVSIIGKQQGRWKIAKSNAGCQGIQNIIFGDQKGKMRIYSVQGQLIKTLSIANSSITKLYHIPNTNNIVVCLQQGLMILYDLKQESNIHQKFAHSTIITSIFAKHNLLYTTSLDKRVIVWSLQQSKRIWQKKNLRKGGCNILGVGQKVWCWSEQGGMIFDMK